MLHVLCMMCVLCLLCSLTCKAAHDEGEAAETASQQGCQRAHPPQLSEGWDLRLDRSRPAGVKPNSGVAGGVTQQRPLACRANRAAHALIGY